MRKGSLAAELSKRARRGVTLADATGAHDTTPGSDAKGGYVISPDQFDRNRARSEKALKRGTKRRRGRVPDGAYGMPGRDQNV